MGERVKSKKYHSFWIVYGRRANAIAFGEQKVVWLKSINFIANSQTGNAKGTLELLERLKSIQVDSCSAISVLITTVRFTRCEASINGVPNPNFKLIDTAKDEFSKLEIEFRLYARKNRFQLQKVRFNRWWRKLMQIPLVSVEIEKLLSMWEKRGALMNRRSMP